jgi:hypothetical protein
LKVPQLGQVSTVRPMGVPQLWQGRGIRDARRLTP